MDFMAINGVVVKPPQELTVDLHTIHADSSGRNADGKMMIDEIAQKARLICRWGPLSDEEVRALLISIRQPFFSVTYSDPEVGGMVTRTFYCGDRSAPVYSWHPKFRALKWQGLSVAFIEQ